MNTLTINASARDQAGSASSGRLRAEGRVPAVVYGKSRKPENLSIDSREFRILLRAIGNNTPVVQLKSGDGDARTSVIKEVQRDPIKDTYTHVDFQEIASDELVVLEIPVHPIGEPDGVKNEGGTIETVSHSVSVRSLPKDIPSSIDADVRALKVGDSFHVSQLPAIEGVTYLDAPDQPVFAIVK